MRITESERVRIALPGGERENDVISYLQILGLQLEQADRKYLIPVSNLPVDLVVIRASDVPRFVDDPDSQLSGGLTGSDILWEYGQKDRGKDLPVASLIPEAKRSTLFIGATPNLLKQIPSPQRSDLTRGRVATKFPNIAKEVLGPKLDLIVVPGKDEAMQYLFQDCYGVLGIKDTGETIRANGIQVLELLEETTCRIIEAVQGKMNRVQEQILADFLGILVETRKIYRPPELRFVYDSSDPRID